MVSFLLLKQLHPVLNKVIPASAMRQGSTLDIQQVPASPRTNMEGDSTGPLLIALQSCSPWQNPVFPLIWCCWGLWHVYWEFGLHKWVSQRMLVNICCHKVPAMSCGWFPASGPARSLQRMSLKGDALPGHLITASTSLYHSSYPSARLF